MLALFDLAWRSRDERWDANGVIGSGVRRYLDDAGLWKVGWYRERQRQEAEESSGESSQQPVALCWVSTWKLGARCSCCQAGSGDVTRVHTYRRRAGVSEGWEIRGDVAWCSCGWVGGGAVVVWGVESGGGVGGSTEGKSGRRSSCARAE